MCLCVRARVFANVFVCICVCVCVLPCNLTNTLTYSTVCSYHMTDPSGIIFSPFYPSYYLDNMECTWHITVPEGDVIRLNFSEFRLEDHLTCASDFVEIFDGRNNHARRLGKFCGYTYNPVIQSSSNHMLVLFRSNDKFTTTGFKAHYQSLQGNQLYFCVVNLCTLVMHIHAVIMI